MPPHATKHMPTRVPFSRGELQQVCCYVLMQISTLELFWEMVFGAGRKTKDREEGLIVNLAYRRDANVGETCNVWGHRTSQDPTFL